MGWYDDDLTIRQQADREGVSYRNHGAGDVDYYDTIDAGERGCGRYEYDGQLYRTKEERDYAHWADHL